MRYRSFCAKAIVLLAATCSYVRMYGQDTLRLTIQEAEQQFLQKNLQLLAARYDISIARAEVIQAKLYHNPSIQASAALYNQDQKKIFDVSNGTGQYNISVQQLITLAGKRNKQIRLAEINTQQAENAFFDLLRTLRFTLRSDFYTAYFLRRSITAFNTQITTLLGIDAAYAALQGKGAITLKDAVRIRSLLYSLQAQQTDLQNQFNDVHAELQLFLQDNTTPLIPEADNSLSASPADKFTLASLVDTAYANRYDLKLAHANLLYNQQQYALQKALRISDLTLGAEYDKRGSYINNASFLNAAIDLPFFNRNQGNIKAAKISIEQSQAQLQQQKAVVENDVQKAYIKMLNTQKMLRSFDAGFQKQFEQLMQGVFDNFKKKNISLIDFTDFVESYRNNMLQLNALENESRQAAESLNFAVGKSIIE